MYTLIVDCSAFGMIPSVYVADPAGNVVGATHLAINNVASYAAADNRVESIKLSGPTEYCMGIKEDIEKELALEYAERKINVEVLK